MTSIREQIMTAVYDRIAAVTSFENVQRLAGDVKLLSRFPTVAIQATSGRKQPGPMHGPGGFETETIDVSIAVLIQITDAGDAGFAPVIDAELTKIERAVLEDGANEPPNWWGGLALNTTVDGWSLIDTEEGQEVVGGELRAQITYRHRYGDPEIAA